MLPIPGAVLKASCYLFSLRHLAITFFLEAPCCLSCTCTVLMLQFGTSIDAIYHACSVSLGACTCVKSLLVGTVPLPGRRRCGLAQDESNISWESELELNPLSEGAGLTFFASRTGTAFSIRSWLVSVSLVFILSSTR